MAWWLLVPVLTFWSMDVAAQNSAVVLDIESEDAPQLAQRLTARINSLLEDTTGYARRTNVSFSLDEARMTFDCEVATVACMQAAAENFQTPLLIWGTITGRTPVRIVIHRIDNGQESGQHTIDTTLDDLTEAEMALDDLVTAFLERRSYQAPVILSVTTAPYGADVFLNDRAMGQTPLKAKVPAGDHQIAIEKEGFERIRQPVLLRDRRTELHFRLSRAVDISESMAVTVVEDPVEPVERGWAFWTSIGSGVVAAAGIAGGIYYGLETKRIDDTLQSNGAAYTANATQLQRAILAGSASESEAEQKRTALAQLNLAFEPEQRRLTQEYEDAQVMANISWIVTAVALTATGVSWYMHESTPTVRVAPDQISLSVSF